MMATAVVVLAGTIAIGVRGIENIKAYNQAVEAAVRRDWATAYDHLVTAAQLAPGMPFYHRQLGVVAGYLAEEESVYRREAITQYQSALTGLDQLAVDHANLACLLGQAGQPAEAVRELRLALELEPGNPRYHLNLGQALEQTGDYPAAWSQYADVLAAWPDEVQSSFWSQSQLRREALSEIVTAAAGRLVKTGPAGAPQLIQLYLYAGNIELARQTYDQLLAQGPVDPLARHLAKGRILQAQNRLAEAQAEVEAALAVEPAGSEVYMMLSEIALAQHRLEAAEESAEAALFLAENPDTLYQAAQTAAAAGHQARAIDLYEAAFNALTADDDPNLARYATEVARRRPLPLNYLPCLSRIYPTPRLVALTLAEGRLLEQQGDFQAAAQVYERLLVYEPDAAAVSARFEELCRARPAVCDFRANR